MVPTLPPGGMALFDCFDHAIRGSSTSLDQITIKTLHPGIEAGDVVAFRPPRMIEGTWTKRVVGLPGDRVEVRDGKLVINGTAAATEPSGDYRADAGVPPPWPILRETLENGRSYLILADRPGSSVANMGAVTVPAGSLFVLGDNRPDSLDGRYQPQFGFVPLANLVAHVSVVEAATPAPDAVALAQPRPSGPARGP